MSLYAIGAVGSPVRLYLDTDRPSVAALQAGPDEVVLSIPIRPMGAAAIMKTDEGYVLVPQVDPVHALNLVRAERTRRLADSDWTQLPDAALTPDQVAAWAAYRQALRDLIQTQPEAAPETVIWPVPPTET